MALMPCSAQKSTSRPWKESTRTLSNFAVTSRNMSRRSSIVNRPSFVSLTSTATVTSSNRFEARSTMSKCPLVTGSNDPGHTTLVMAVTVPKDRVAIFLLLARLDSVGPAQTVALRAFDNDERFRSRPHWFAQRCEEFVQFARGEGVRRVDEKHIVWRPRRSLQEARSAAHDNLCAADREVRDVHLDDLCGRAVLLHEVSRRRASGQCLEPDGAGAGEQIEETQTVERSVLGLQRREQCFTDAVGCWPCAVTRWHLNPAAAVRAGDDTGHVFSR